MDSNKILNSSYLDIIFDGRNKSYGSYELRTKYPKRMKTGAMFLAAFLFVSFAYKVMADKMSNKIKLAIPETAHVIDIADVKPDIPKKQQELPKQTQESPTPVKSFKITTPKIEEDDLVQKKDLMTSQDDLKHAVAGKLTMTGDSLGNESLDLDDTKGKGNRGGLPIVTGGDKTVDTKPVSVVEQMPEFPGGESALHKYLNDHIEYPSAASSANMQGNVRIKFVVNEDGSISNAEVTKGFGYGSEAEAIRVVNGMPLWKPGRNNGKAVKVWFYLPITFKLN